MLEILAPILLLVALGAFLARVRFLGPSFMGDLNKLVFWVGLPAALIRSVAGAKAPGSGLLPLLGLLIIATLLVTVAGWGAARLLVIPSSSAGTLSQAAFRGNLAYIGIPVLTLSLENVSSGPESLSMALIVIATLMVLYNILAVIVLSGGPSERGIGKVIKAILTNPLILAILVGLVLGGAGVRIPRFLDSALELLGSSAVPIALLCIGGSFSQVHLGGRMGGIVAAVALKNFALPAFVYAAAPLFQIAGVNLRIALVLAACPTAAASYVMAKQMKGDEALAGGAIVLSTLMALLSISLALLLSPI